MIPKDHFFYFRAMYLISKHVTNLFSTQFIEILLYYALQETLFFFNGMLDFCSVKNRIRVYVNILFHIVRETRYQISCFRQRNFNAHRAI